MKLSFLSFVALSSVFVADAFVVPSVRSVSSTATHLASSPSDETTTDLGLTPELQKMTDAFEMIGDNELRYKQLLYMASNTERANNMPEESKVPENKVPGCMSTVYIDGTARYDDEAGDYVVDMIGDSDGLLSRGLVAMLVRGVSGCTAEQIQKINPEFIKTAGIAQSLTPGRNNGFLNMVAMIKHKSKLIDAAARGEGASGTAETTEDVETGNDSSKGPKYNAIVSALQMLKPTVLKLTDNSHQHAGHAGNDMDGESHFELEIVTEAFEGLSLVKRHQLVYMVLGEIMPQIHALQIKASTPEEVSE